jgi:hypothetical protein
LRDLFFNLIILSWLRGKFNLLSLPINHPGEAVELTSTITPIQNSA